MTCDAQPLCFTHRHERASAPVFGWRRRRGHCCGQGDSVISCAGKGPKTNACWHIPCDALLQYLERHLSAIQDDPSRIFLAGGCVTIADLLIITGAQHPTPTPVVLSPHTVIFSQNSISSRCKSFCFLICVAILHDFAQTAAFNLFDFQPFPAVRFPTPNPFEQ